MIGPKDFRNPKNQFEDQTKSSINLFIYIKKKPKVLFESRTKQHGFKLSNYATIDTKMFQ
jgi:hypothetical protein